MSEWCKQEGELSSPSVGASWVSHGKDLVFTKVPLEGTLTRWEYKARERRIKVGDRNSVTTLKAAAAETKAGVGCPQQK